MKIELTFIEPILGTLSGNKDIAKEFIISKHPNAINGGGDDEEKALDNGDVDREIEKATTIFARDSEGCLVFWDYHIKGFFKSACKAMLLSEDFKQETLKKVKLTNYSHKRTIDLLIFANPRMIKLELPENGKITWCERPLRGETMRGERISLARSEQLPAGTKMFFEVEFMNKKLEPFIMWWLDYGKYSGFGQWRNSGKGRFKYKVID